MKNDCIPWLKPVLPRCWSWGTEFIRAPVSVASAHTDTVPAWGLVPRFLRALVAGALVLPTGSAQNPDPK